MRSPTTSFAERPPSRSVIVHRRACPILSRIPSRALQALQRRESRLNKQLKLVVQAPTGNDERIWGIRSGHELNARSLHCIHQIERVLSGR